MNHEGVYHQPETIVLTCAAALLDELSQQYQQLIDTLETSLDQQQQITTDLGVTASALRHFLSTVQQQAVPLADLDSTLREIAWHYQELQTRIGTLRGNDPEVTRHTNNAQRALEAGAYDRAEALLNAASARAIELGKKRQAMVTKQLLAAAQAKAANGDLKNSQLMYVEVAAYYGEAAALLTTINIPLPRAAYLNQEGLAWLKAGQYSKAQPLLEHARVLRERTLGPEHPDVATSLNNLAGLYHTQGQYAQAAPLYRRALAIREKAFGPEHPDVATVVRNYTTLLQTLDRHDEAAQILRRWQAAQAPRAWLGIQPRPSTNPAGILVEQVIAGSPAAQAGLQPQDVIVRVNAHEVHDSQTFHRSVGRLAPGSTVDLEVIHNGQRRKLPVTLAVRPLPTP